uniref:Uncharacterized protein n=1 Tax=uncultured Rhodospirillales bacterium HF0200_01O14 TaxID=710787 RepID=E0XTT4_9PROT|nr:hypothetical protein [uncultured Rhodospirillales bacterium HF0200_01O14]
MAPCLSLAESCGQSRHSVCVPDTSGRKFKTIRRGNPVRRTDARRTVSSRDLQTDYIVLLSVTAWVHAPSGFLVITGSDPPDSRLSTVRS